MTQKLSVAEIKAVAEAAITAKQTANSARQAADDAGGADEALNTAANAAERASKEASDKADALSQQSIEPGPEDKKAVSKLLKKKAIIDSELRRRGVISDEDDDDEEEVDMDDPNRPLTVGDFNRIEARKAQNTAVQMADAITDIAARDAVKEALKRVVPSGDPAKDFTDAVAIANRERNSKVLDEISRKGPPIRHASGAGAPPRPADAEFVPTDEENRFIKAGWLTLDDVKEARIRAEAQAK